MQNKYEQQEIFYKVMRSERLAIFFILTLILIIASFNIIGSLTMLIIEKERDIEILKSLGANNNLIRKIFIFEGWLISIIGAFIGLLLGFLVCWLQQKYGFVKLQGETLISGFLPGGYEIFRFYNCVRYCSSDRILGSMVPGKISHQEISAQMKERSSVFKALMQKVVLSVILISSCGPSCVNERIKRNMTI